MAEVYTVLVEHNAVSPIQALWKEKRKGTVAASKEIHFVADVTIQTVARGPSENLVSI